MYIISHGRFSGVFGNVSVSVRDAEEKDQMWRNGGIEVITNIRK